VNLKVKEGEHDLPDLLISCAFSFGRHLVVNLVFQSVEKLADEEDEKRETL
jgi:hypothetical protein